MNKRNLLLSKAYLASFIILSACNSGTQNSTTTPTLTKNSYICVSDYLNINNIESGIDCRSITAKNIVQNTFTQTMVTINQILVTNHYATTLKGIQQPTDIFPDWASLSIESRAALMSDYGFNVAQNQRLKPFLNKVCGNNLCINYFLAPSAKKIERVIEKYPDGQVENNIDYSRATIIMDYKNLPAILNRFSSLETKDFQIAVVENRLTHPTGTHYRDLSVFIKDTSSNFISEILILGPRMGECKNGLSHSLYEEIRSREASIELEKLKPTPNQTLINELENEVNTFKAQLFTVHDDIFRADAATSCNLQHKEECMKEVSKYITSNDCGA